MGPFFLNNCWESKCIHKPPQVTDILEVIPTYSSRPWQEKLPGGPLWWFFWPRHFSPLSSANFVPCDMFLQLFTASHNLCSFFTLSEHFVHNLFCPFCSSKEWSYLDWGHERDYRRYEGSAASIFRVKCSFTPIRFHGVVAQKITVHSLTSVMARSSLSQSPVYLIWCAVGSIYIRETIKGGGNVWMRWWR